MVQSSASSLVSTPRFRIAWLGDDEGIELALARRWAGELAEVVGLEADRGAKTAAAQHEDPWTDAGMHAAAPTAVILAGSRPGAWDLQRATAVARRWPLAPLVSLATSLDDGRRRSGPTIPGVEEMVWTDLPGRLAWWFAELAAGRPGSLGLPATVRREERLLDTAARLQAMPVTPGCGSRIAVAAGRRPDVEGLADLVTALGRTVTTRTCGRPPLDVVADTVLWDVGPTAPADLTWLRMLAAHRPDLPVVVVESFPRGDTVLTALRAGAAAVLGRPLALEALAGTLLRLEPPGLRISRAGTGIGSGVGDG